MEIEQENNHDKQHHGHHQQKSQLLLLEGQLYVHPIHAGNCRQDADKDSKDGEKTVRQLTDGFFIYKLWAPTFYNRFKNQNDEKNNHYNRVNNLCIDFSTL